MPVKLKTASPFLAKPVKRRHFKLKSDKKKIETY